jgi:hypothetical protein
LSCAQFQNKYGGLNPYDLPLLASKYTQAGPAKLLWKYYVCVYYAYVKFGRLFLPGAALLQEKRMSPDEKTSPLKRHRHIKACNQFTVHLGEPHRRTIKNTGDCLFFPGDKAVNRCHL